MDPETVTLNVFQGQGDGRGQGDDSDIRDANERHELRRAVAEAVGFKIDYHSAIIHWTDDDA